MNEDHKKAEELASKAEIASGDIALQYYKQAANHEAKAFFTTPKDQSRTRGILAVSVVSLLCKAKDKSMQSIGELMLIQDLPEFANEQIREILDKGLGD